MTFAGFIGASCSPRRAPPPATTPPISGWTDFVAQPGALTIYVSDTGNDSNDGLSELTPKLTFAAGYALLRNGYADWMLLKRGSTWFIDNIYWSKSGPIADDSGWMRLGAYGDESDPRPVIDTNLSSGLTLTPGFEAVTPISYLAMTDIKFTASGRIADPATAPASVNGVFFVAVSYGGAGEPFQHILLENMFITGYEFGAIVGGEDLRIRRSIFTEIFSPGGAGVNSSGVLTGAQGLLLEDNIYYRIQYPTMPNVTTMSFFSHSAYITAEATNVVSRANIIIQATEGLMQRPGGVYDRNAVCDTSIAGLAGQATGVTPTPGGVTLAITDNVFVNSDGDYQIGNTQSGDVLRNLMVRGPESSTNINLSFIGVNGANIGVHDVNLTDNLMSGDFTYSPAPGNPSDYSGLVFTTNTVNRGQTTETLSDFCIDLGLGAGDSDTWGAYLLTRDRLNWGATFTSLPFLNYYRVSNGLPSL